MSYFIWHWNGYEFMHAPFQNTINETYPNLASSIAINPSETNPNDQDQSVHNNLNKSWE